MEWLLRDEIVSALRHLQPLNADALEFVTQHVRSSFRLMRPSSVHEKVSLQFVFGPDRSMKYFIEVCLPCQKRQIFGKTHDPKKQNLMLIHLNQTAFLLRIAEGLCK